MAEEVILSTIEKIDRCLLNTTEYYRKKAVEGVKNEFMLILDFLKDSVCSRNKLVNYLIDDVVELARDVREIVSIEYGYLDAVEDRLKKLKERILHMGGEAGQGASIPYPVAPRRSPNVVGLEETIKSLLHQEILSGKIWHFTQGPYLCVIEGVGGIGKTTLAKELYNHADVVAHFHHRAWVCVSGGKSYKQILMELIVQVGEGKGFELLEKMDNGSLQKMLWHYLNKKYFIVLDGADGDTCSKSIFQGLPNDTESRLLLTTQSQIRTCRFISSFTNCYDCYHKMKFLEDDKTWELFLQKVFYGKTSNHYFPKKLEKKARKLLKQCGGLPLAIIELSKQVAIKRQSGSEWEEVLEYNIDFTRTLTALESSYNKLNPKAKAVFLCVGFFEEGTTIRLEKLLQIGIAQGAIASKNEGDYALNSLKLRSFIEITHTTKVLRPKNVEIKIIFHKLSVKKAKEEINFEIIRNNASSLSSRKPFHCAIYCGREKFSHYTNQDEHLVSLFFRGGGNFDASPSYWERFEQLVILDMEGFGLKMVPESIGMLTRLRYLGLRNNYIQTLPISLRCLKKLEVLDIALNFMVEVPDIIWEMGSLRHLYMSNVNCMGSLKIEALENIETLTYISVYNWTYELSGSQMMNNLRKLGIEEIDGNSDVSKLFASLAKLTNIYSLSLRGFRFKTMPLLDDIGILHHITTLKLDGLLTRLPSANNFPPKIRYLTLVNSSLDEDPMPVLEKLSSLYFLKLQNAYTGQEMVISNDGFVSLNFLHINELWHLRNIHVRKLQKWGLHLLEINECPYLETLPKVTSKRKGFKIVTNHKNCMKHKRRW